MPNNSGYGNNFVIAILTNRNDLCWWIAWNIVGISPMPAVVFNELFNNTSGPKTEPCGVPHSALYVSKLYVVYIQWVASVSVSDLRINLRGS